MFESRVGVELEDAFAVEYMMAPYEKPYGGQSEAFAGPTVIESEL